jgi:hypothetical protein
MFETLGEFCEINLLRFIGVRRAARCMRGCLLSRHQQRRCATRTRRASGFQAVDTQRHGYLTSDDIKNDDYVSKNFAKCNLTHNGHMTPEEYANCHE